MWRNRAYSKFGNVRLDKPSGVFDSRLEYQQFLDLTLLEKVGKISNLQRQVRIKLGQSEKCKVHYIADFVYFDNEKGVWVIHDAKGFETPEFKLKLKWLLDTYKGFIFKVSFKREFKFYEPFNENAKELKFEKLFI